MAKGIDVYTANQKVVSWQQVRSAGYEFAYVKVSDGVTTRATNNYGPNGRAAGVKMGAYHFAQPGNASAQADLLVSQARANGLLDLAPALDIESGRTHTWKTQEAIDFSIVFLKRVKALGHLPCIYANNSMLTAILPAVRAAVPDVKVWAARYGGTPSVTHDVHQWSETGTVPGIVSPNTGRSTTVDLNVGSIPLNTSGGGESTGGDTKIDEELFMLVPAATDDYISIPANGNDYLYIGTHFGRSVELMEIWAVGDSPSTGSKVNYIGKLTVAPDRPGGISIKSDFPVRTVNIRYKAEHSFTAWTA